MASNLAKAGFPLLVYDVNLQASKKFQDSYYDLVEVAKDVSEVASKVDQIITMLPSSPHVKSVYLGADSCLTSTMRKNTLCIDASTIDPNVARDVAEQVTNRGSIMVDAPVSGGVLGAEKGTLTFMVGGTKEAFEQSKQLLTFMGKNIIHCGSSGKGQVVKVCNNVALAIEMIGISEAMNLGIKLGMDPKLLAQIFNTSTSRCWSSDAYNPVPGVMPGVPSSLEYAGGFGVDLMLKDLGLAIGAATQEGVPTPLGKQAAALYKLMSSKGYGGLDFSSVYHFLKSNSEEVVEPPPGSS